jgi:hypothetical protein
MVISINHWNQENNKGTGGEIPVRTEWLFRWENLNILPFGSYDVLIGGLVGSTFNIF